MTAWLAFLWRWSMLVTLPACVLFSHWAWHTASPYLSFDLRYGMGVPVHPLHERGVRAFERIARWPVSDPAHPSGLRRIALAVAAADLARLDANLPHSADSYVDGHLWTDAGWQKVDVRYRGDFPVHWGYAKKSLRVRTRRSEPFEGMRRFNLIVPKFPQLVNDHLGYRLARLLGVLAPTSEVVEVLLNGRRAGVYVLVEQPDESTLQRAGLVPGDLYSGDLIARDAWPGVPNLLFDAPGLWEKQVSNPRLPPDFRGPLEELIRLVNEPASDELHARLAELVDVTAFARFAATEILTQSFHTNANHNWRVYYDPWRARFSPLVWDLNAWGGLGLGASPELRYSQDLDLTRLHALLLTNATFLQERRRALAEFFAGGAERFLEEARASVLSAEAALESDADHFAADPDGARRLLRELPEQIRALFQAVMREHLTDGTVRYSLPAPGRAIVEVAGRAAVDRIEVLLDRPTVEPVRVTLHLQRDGRDVTAEVPDVLLHGDRIRFPVALPTQLQPSYSTGGFRYVIYGRVPVATRCAFELKGLPEGASIAGILVALGDGPVRPAELRAAMELTSMDHLFGVLPEATGGENWRGEVRIAGTRVVRGPLRLDPGTVVRLSPGASLILKGRLTAKGTASAPIRFLATEDGPWGTVALVGRGTAGSRLYHCEFEGGTGLADPRDLSQFPGMLAVHDTADVVVADSTFRRGRVVDSLLHAAYSRLDLLRCEFTGARLDALRLEQCAATIDGCRFRQCGADGVLAVGSRCLIRDSTFDDCRAAGIAVSASGELVVVNSRLRGCQTGVQARDGSRALAGNADFLDNVTAVDARSQDKRSDRGSVFRAVKSVFWGNQRVASADGSSRVSLFDSSVHPETAPALMEASVDRTVEQARSRAPMVPELGIEDDGPRPLSALADLGPWRLEPGRRGCDLPQ